MQMFEFPFNISLKFIPKGSIDNIPALVQIMAWRYSRGKPLSESILVWFTEAYMRHSASMILLIEAEWCIYASVI